MFHLHSLKEPQPKRMCEKINFTSEIEADLSNQGSQPLPIQRQADQFSDSQRSCRDQYNETIPTCGCQLSRKALWQTESRISIQVRFSEFPWLHYNEQSDSVLCFIRM